MNVYNPNNQAVNYPKMCKVNSTEEQIEQVKQQIENRLRVLKEEEEIKNNPPHIKQHSAHNDSLAVNQNTEKQKYQPVRNASQQIAKRDEEYE